MACPNLSDLIASQNQMLKPHTQQEIDRHLKGCSSCQSRMNVHARLAEFIRRNHMVNMPAPGSECYDDIGIVDYLEGDLGRAERRRFQTHLAGCDGCQDALVALDRMLFELKSEGVLPVESQARNQSPEKSIEANERLVDKLRAVWDAVLSPGPAFGWAGVAVILVVAALAVFRPWSQDQTRLVTREPETSSSNVLSLQFPENQSSVQSSRFDFRWLGPDNVSSYAFLLLDAQGTIIWEQRTKESTISPPTEIQIQPSTTYFWQVEGFFESGGSLLSEMASFTYHPK